MLMNLAVLTLAALLGTAGVVGMFLGGLTGEPQARARFLRLGSAGLIAGGLCLCFGDLAGWVRGDVFFGGFLMALLGSGVGTARVEKADASSAPSRTR